MKGILMRIRSGMRANISLLKKNFILLFVVAIVLGGSVKVVASKFIVIGYKDYLIERHVGFDFAQMKRDVAERNKEMQQGQGEE